jgi:hypothetical protein
MKVSAGAIFGPQRVGQIIKGNLMTTATPKPKPREAASCPYENNEYCHDAGPCSGSRPDVLVLEEVRFQVPIRRD